MSAQRTALTPSEGGDSPPSIYRPCSKSSGVRLPAFNGGPGFELFEPLYFTYLLRTALQQCVYLLEDLIISEVLQVNGPGRAH